MDERAYYIESQTTKPATLNCPYCRSAETYDLQMDGAQEEGPAAAGRRRARPREVRESAELHGAAGR